jgi:DNA-binding transcriptional regulator YhcF (GntR family)
MAVIWADFHTRPGATYHYVQLADWIEGQIKAGKLMPGDRLPAQRELAGLTGTSVELTGRAMATLRERGLVETSAHGSFIRSADG